MLGCLKEMDFNKATITITFSDKIDSDSVHRFIDKLEQLNNAHPDCSQLVINISSSGGDIDTAVELFNFIKSLDCHVRIVNTSYVNSAAIIVFLAGDERICLPTSSFYVHSVTKRLDGIYNAGSLMREVREINANTDKIATLLESTTKKNKAYWKRLMRKGQMLSAEKALEVGLTTTEQ